RRADEGDSTRPSPATLRAGPPDRAITPSQPQRDRAPSGGWTVFVGTVIALAAVREAGRRLADNPVAARAKGASREDAFFALALVLRILRRVGAWVLGASRA